ncbi:nitric oxide reductase transcriptional regulator NorR [Halopseudomonas bauzanensis]|uniref:nitric oxide reductase transcriptional regulator NorR n=1 Tax=Halopseudomonas bauzanensis TaxID=653930 RepID=UPI0025537BEB|nr:nitric oxide reductase transcriptional regulator NorR [Halopseudomonas bauzanensis]
MTPSPVLTTLLPLLDDLSRDLPQAEHYQRLLLALRACLPCDALALLRLEDDLLVPVAVLGLSPDTLGRRFRVSEHPRLAQVLASGGATRFAADCELPDPYDGLVEGTRGRLQVHDCLGCPLTIDDRPWGLLSLDSLDPARFGHIDLPSLEAFTRLAAATVKACERMNSLTRQAADERRRAETWRQAARCTPSRELIGTSPAHRHLLKEIDLVAKSQLSVLISGETGVGKELVAQAVHQQSDRRHKPLISLNCAALPEALVESELFGHVRGAFSGATGSRGGKFELADGGTLFLDEVGELPLSVQAKLLRVLQNGQLQRLGSDQERHVDVRIIAATNRELAEEVRAGRFRADLYHRLGAYPLRVPALRERDGDVLLLAGHFLERGRTRLQPSGLGLSQSARDALLAYDWPGNVRELEHLIGRAMLRARANSARSPLPLQLSAADLELTAVATPTTAAAQVADTQLPPGGLRQAVDAYQRQLIETVLSRNQGNLSATARHLQIDRGNLHRLTRRLGLTTDGRTTRRNGPPG